MYVADAYGKTERAVGTVAPTVYKVYGTVVPIVSRTGIPTLYAVRKWFLKE